MQVIDSSCMPQVSSSKASRRCRPSVKEVACNYGSSEIAQTHRLSHKFS